ncbi:Pycsar system effector family protein [Streptomyces sp. NPDC059396]|uniref:Pycsar system effector family protein n=1 Tax=Streptomyces sp. NPDC059396 TaxID=3346819 RepID=UPI0036D0BFEF
MSDENLNRALDHTAGEIARTDTKAGVLLTLDALLVAALSLLGADVHGVALGLAVLVAVALVVSVVLALAVIRPRLAARGATDRASFVHWATADPADIEAGLREDRRLHRLHTLSRIALRKMRYLRGAGDASLVAVIALAAAMLTR